MSPKKQELDFKFSQTISDIINGIFALFYDECENHKECGSVLHSSKARNFSSSFRYGPWAFGSLDLRIGSPKTGQW